MNPPRWNSYSWFATYLHLRGLFRLLVAVLPLGLPLAAAPVEFPSTPAGQVLAGYLEALNSGNKEKLEAFIKRHGRVRVLEIVENFEGMDAAALWHDIKFSLRHLDDFSRVAIVCNPHTHHLWSSLASPLISCEVEHFAPGEEAAARDWLMWPESAADA